MRPRSQIPGHVLVIDDDEHLREDVCLLLRRFGLEVSTAFNGLDALTKLHSGAQLPHVILLDLMMPVMDGWTFCVHAGADPALAAIPIIVISALDDDVPAGIARFLRKPFDFEVLLDAIEHLCVPTE